MTSTNQKEMIISLIKDDLVNTKLVNGLSNIGLCPGDFHLNLSDTILNLLGLETEDDAIQDVYFSLTQKSDSLDLADIPNREKCLTILATEIYTKLLQLKG